MLLEGEGVLSRSWSRSRSARRWGFLGFDDYLTERVWPVAEVEALKAAADTLGAAIGRTGSSSNAPRNKPPQQLELRTSAVLASALEAIVTMDEQGTSWT